MKSQDNQEILSIRDKYVLHEETKPDELWRLDRRKLLEKAKCQYVPRILEQTAELTGNN